MTRSGPSRGNGSPGFGVALAAGGLLLLLHNLGMLDLRDAIRAAAIALRDLWPLLFVVGGARLIVESLRRRRGRVAGGAAAPEARS